MAGAPSIIPFTTYNMTVGPILSEIQRHLLEPAIDEGQTWQLWTSNEVLNYLRERISRFLVETSVVVDREGFTLLAGQASLDLISTLAELQNIWVTRSPLVPMDYWSADYGKPGWQDSTGTPYAFSENPLTPLNIQIIPASDASAVGSYTYVKSTPLDPPSEDAEAGTNLGDYYLRLPSIFSWAIKYGVMADMLGKEGEANDPERASYCEQRYGEGVELAKLMVKGRG